jgi:hypothetical protein
MTNKEKKNNRTDGGIRAAAISEVQQNKKAQILLEENGHSGQTLMQTCNKIQE